MKRYLCEKNEELLVSFREPEPIDDIPDEQYDNPMEISKRNYLPIGCAWAIAGVVTVALFIYLAYKWG